ncbi:hypothetical protein [Streptomyces odonnellii]|uniref:hypothetical protein n=1 Tax=Streptomyces odonnellii TaxID=1417980 RepID=UPI00062602B7|nr:hypothetical protein [Streptomyces odonnellii]
MADNGSARLAAGAVTFVTANEDRDHDTGINISVKTPDGVEVASISVPFGVFKDGTTAGPYPLDVLTETTKDGLSNGTATITIHPNGDDTWRFDMRLRLRFTDNTHLSVSAENIELNDDRNTTQISLGGPPN